MFRLLFVVIFREQHYIPKDNIALAIACSAVNGKIHGTSIPLLKLLVYDDAP